MQDRKSRRRARKRSKRRSGRKTGWLQPKRYSEIASVLVKYGFSDVMRRSGLPGKIPALRRLIPKKEDKRLSDFSPWERIRMAAEELGPTFVKFGQIASARRDLMPLELAAELEKLQDRVPPVDFAQIKEVVEKDLGRPLDVLFSSFEERPTASASIAQVHPAVLADGSRVAVKVKRPNIEATVESDLAILRSLAALVERAIPSARLFDPSGLVEEFDEQIHDEMNFDLELLNIRRFASNMSEERDICVPDVYKEHSSRNVLTMEYMEGVKVTEITGESDGGFDKAAIARRGARLHLKQIFEHGFFHGDPHAGNLQVLPGGRICYLDFGIMGAISPDQREILSTMMFAIAKRKSDRLADALLDLTTPSGPVDKRLLQRRTYELMNRFVDLPLELLDMREIIGEIFRLVLDFGLKFPPDLALMLKVLIILEGIGRDLDPGFEIIRLIEPYSERLFLKDTFAPARILELLFFFLRDSRDLIEHLPTDLQQALDTVKKGVLQLEVKGGSLGFLKRILDGVSDRLVLALVLAALLISSSLIVLADVAPKWNGIPVLGLIGYVLAGVVGFGLVVSLLAKGLRRKDREPGEGR